jgi:hypothetical protein
MKTAYQVNDSCEDLATILSANSEIDWHELAKINLDQVTHKDDKIINNTYNVHIQEQSDNPIQDLLLQTVNNKATYPCILESITSLQSSATSCNTNCEISNKDNFVQESKSNTGNGSNKYLKIEDSIKEINQSSENQVCDKQEKISQSMEHSEETEHGLVKIMKENLRDILHEGLLDSVLPYMLPKSTLSQPIIKKSNVAMDIKKSSSLNNIIESKIIASTSKEKDKEKNKNNKKLIEYVFH